MKIGVCGTCGQVSEVYGTMISGFITANKSYVIDNPQDQICHTCVAAEYAASMENMKSKNCHCDNCTKKLGKTIKRTGNFGHTESEKCD
jgi:hypothetical protein